MKTRNGKNKLRVIRPVNYRSKLAVYYKTYRLAEPFPKYDRTVSKAVAKVAKRITALVKPRIFTRSIRS